MTDACLICETEAVELDDWYLKIRDAHGKIAVIECICPWCVKEWIKTVQGFGSMEKEK